jgi:hypothetical protein
MPDIGKIKRNVAKMVGQNAPESDIDSYIKSEGTSIDEIKNFKEGVQPEHPFGWRPNPDDIQQPATSFLGQLQRQFPGLAQAGGNAQKALTKNYLEQPQGAEVPNSPVGNAIAGTLNTGAGLVESAFSPVGAANEILKGAPFVGQPLSAMINPMTYWNAGTKMISGMGNALGDIVGLSPETKQTIGNAGLPSNVGNAIVRLIQDTAPFLLAKPVGEMANQIGTNIVQNISRVGNRLEQPAIGVSTNKNTSVQENRRLADFNLNQVKYGVGADEHIRLTNDLAQHQEGTNVGLAKADDSGVLVDLNPVKAEINKNLSSPKFIGQRNVLKGIADQVNQSFDDVAADYPDSKVPPTVAYNFKRNMFDLAKNAMDSPDASLVGRIYKSIGGKTLDAIDQVVPGIRERGLAEQQLTSLRDNIGNKQKRGEASAPGGNLASWKVPVISNPTVLHGLAKAANFIGGGYVDPTLMGSVPANADLTSVSMPRGQGGYYQQPPFALLPQSNTRYVPEYQSPSNGYPNSAPQMADQLRTQTGQYPSIGYDIKYQQPTDILNSYGLRDIKPTEMMGTKMYNVLDPVTKQHINILESVASDPAKLEVYLANHRAKGWGGVQQTFGQQ